MLRRSLMVALALAASPPAVHAEPPRAAPLHPSAPPPPDAPGQAPRFPFRLPSPPDLQDDGWGLRGFADEAGLRPVFGPRRPPDLQAGLLWNGDGAHGVLGYSRRDLGPQVAGRWLGAPDMLRAPKEDAPGVVGFGLVVKTP